MLGSLKYLNPMHGLGGSTQIGGESDPSRAPIVQHLTELRDRLIVTLIVLGVLFGIGFWQSRGLFDFIMEPLIRAFIGNQLDFSLVVLDLTEALFTSMGAAFFFALLVGMPFLLVQVWGFVAPGLYRNERKAIGPFLVASPLLFWAGAALAYFVVMPFAFNFLIFFSQLQSGEEWSIEVLPQLSRYLGITMRMVIAFGLAFQVPVLMSLLNRAGLVSAKAMDQGRKYAILIIAIFAALLTPPDGITQLMVGVPMWALYEVSVILAKRFEKRNPDVFGLPEDIEELYREEQEAEKAAMKKG